MNNWEKLENDYLNLIFNSKFKEAYKIFNYLLLVYLVVFLYNRTL